MTRSVQVLSDVVSSLDDLTGLAEQVDVLEARRVAACARRDSLISALLARGVAAADIAFAAGVPSTSLAQLTRTA
jgi:hypothetical protein